MRQERGLTLVELLAATTLLLIILSSTHHAFSRFIPLMQVKSAAAEVHSVIRRARLDAMNKGNTWLCDGNHRCEKFTATQHLIMATDRNGDGEIHTSEISEHYHMPGDTVLVWKRFRGKALVFHNRGIAHFQNGSFYICNEVAARRIVMNWVGRPRVEPASPDDCA